VVLYNYVYRTKHGNVKLDQNLLTQNHSLKHSSLCYTRLTVCFPG